MNVYPQPNSPPVSQDDGGSSTRSDADSATAHSFWHQKSVPKPESDEFREWISGNSEGIEKVPVPIFVPRDQHCGIWHSPPNHSCHSSFGDQGTTASTNCFGNIIQVTQYLGAGRSGLFSMDQASTYEPFFVCERARDLEDLVTNDDFLSYDLRLNSQYLPQEPLNVKWVNWRWPRYEYDMTVPVSKVKASAQWVVHDGIVLKQLVLENVGHEDVEVEFNFPNKMLIRDLDYLDGSYRFNDSKEGYTYVPGPNGFGYVWVHTLEPPAKYDPKTSGEGRTSLDNLANLQCSPRDATLPRPLDNTDKTSATQNQGPSFFSTSVPSANVQIAQPEHYIAAQTLDSSINARKHSPMVNEQGNHTTGDKKKPGPQPQINNSHAVASVITIFVNGKAIRTEGIGDSQKFTLPGNSTQPNDTALELVVAYKMILIPDTPIDWKNFLVPAQKADVNSILQRETESLWGTAESSSLLSIGLSLVDVEADVQNKAAKGSNKENLDNAYNDHIDQGFRNNKPDAGNAVPKERATTSMQVGDGNARPTQNRGTSWSKSDNITFPKGTPGRTSPRDHIEYLMWRHLEHILSVCAVPLSRPALFEDTQCPRSSHAALHSSATDAPVALTCGDMAGHRICTSASFFAFEFLTDVARRLKICGNDSTYVKSLLQRIKTVCQGHILWLENIRTHFSEEQRETQSRLLESGCFAANYWVTGLIMPEESGTWQPNNSITDTPFQILKIVGYRRTWACNSKKEEKAVDDLLLDTWLAWLLELDRTDRRSSYAWPHAFQEGVNTFRLDDHVWVWRALRSLEALDLGRFLKSTQEEKEKSKDSKYHWISLFYGLDREGNGQDGKEAIPNFDKIAKRLLPSEVQRNTLQRFTTENDLGVSRKRMLAVTRSPRETRFLLHSRDTSLFYGENLGFFLPDSSYHELWENTLVAQLHHEENKETAWDNGIRYALGVVAGIRDCPLNNKSPTELVRTCVEVLIRSGSHAGFLPGQLDEATKEPRLFYEEADANFHYHAGFEINHMFLTYARRIVKTLQKAMEFTPRSLRPSATMPTMEKDDMIHEALTEIIMTLKAQPKHQRLIEQSQQNPGLPHTGQLGAATGLDARRSLTMKKLIPFNNLIDVSSINALGDEWLYNYPQFFRMEKIDLQKYVYTRLSSSQPIRDSVGGIIGQELERHRKTIEKKEAFRFPSKSRDVIAVIAEICKKKHFGKGDKREKGIPNYVSSASNHEFWLQLSAPRTAARSKKRFIWLPAANAETAFLCWVASPDAEKPAMSLFLDRHFRCEKHVWDDPTMVVNTWQTELHLSFYKLVDAADPPTLGLPSVSIQRFPGRSKKELRRVSMSFRFDGDFFDRYWTCHYIEHMFTMRDIANWDFYECDDTRIYPFYPLEFTKGHEEKRLWQRKVLELHLLRRILNAANKSSLEILEQVRKELGIGDGALSFSILDSDAYSSTQDSWQSFEYILQAVDEDLSTVLRTLEKWDRREAERGQEKPRWTRNDERNYRSDISKLQGATEKETRDLENHRNSIRKLKETLTTSRKKKRDERELHRNENIRYFTYVTVIFLPLGFAASFYSMNGAPQHALMISLVEFAIAAFGVTVGLLASAKTIYGASDIVRRPLKTLKKQAELGLEQISRAKRERSLLHGERNEQEDAPRSPTLPPGFQLSKSYESPDGQKQALSPRHVAQDASTSPDWFWFWLTYIFFEVPGLRILAAIAVLRNGKLLSRAMAEVVLGIAYLPIFGIAWVCKLVALNLRDFVGLLDPVRQLIVSALSNSTTGQDNEDEDVQGRFDKLTRAPDSFRPFKGLGKRLEERSKADARPPRGEAVTKLGKDTAKDDPSSESEQ